jgi:peptidyl-prolyl cis-trans isomerase B (cyclophilin B)
MKKIILIFIVGFLMGEANSDSLKVDGEKPKIPIDFDLSKGINIPGLDPKNLNSGMKTFLFPYEIEIIKEAAKNFNPEPVTDDDIVIIETTRGTMKLKLFPNDAPNHCKNFKKLANSGFYDKTKFHRIIPGFMIQGGDINSRDNDGKNDGHGGPGWTVNAEFNDIPHKRGILSMARSSDPNSAGSQFFICVADAPHLDGKYTVFGEVIDKVHIVDHIVNTPTENSQAIMMSKERIPDGEDPDDWITLKDPKTKKKLYSKIPKNMSKTDYEYNMRNKIKSDKPAIPVIMEKVRVVNNTIENKETGPVTE